MPIDLFEENNIKNEPVDLFEENNIKLNPSNDVNSISDQKFGRAQDFLSSLKSNKNQTLIQQNPDLKDPRKVSEALLTTAAMGGMLPFAPEIGVGGAVGLGLNALTRMGLGTLGTSAFEHASNPNAPLSNILKRNSIANVALEGLTLPFRGLGKVAEIIRPEKYANKLLEDIKSTYNNALNTQKEAYKPVMEKYSNHLLSINPERYLSLSKNELRRLTPDVKKSYSDFLQEPTFNNLHNMQSQIGKDYARLAGNSNKIITSQTLNNTRNKLKEKINTFLSNDPEQLNNYLRGSEITKNIVSPFRATPTLRKITNGLIQDISPNTLAKTLKKGMENETSHIPEGHYLRNVFNDLTDKINLGEAIGFVPKSNEIAKYAQNPFFRKNIAEKISPVYRGWGRAGIVPLNKFLQGSS